MPVSVTQQTALPITVGGSLAGVERTISQEQIDAYGAVSGDNNPLHYDAEFAATTRFGGVIAHGMLTLALVSEMMAGAFGLHWLISGGLRVRFRGAAYPGDRLETVGTVTKAESDGEVNRVTCNVSVLNADTAEQILSGTATVRIAAKPE